MKRSLVADAQYMAVKGVDIDKLTVDDLKALWVAQAMLAVDRSLVMLRLVPCEARKPKPEEEQAATALDPFETLAAAGVADGCKLLAVVAGACGVARQPSRLAACAHATAAGALPATPVPEQEGRALQAVAAETAVRELREEVKAAVAEKVIELKSEWQSLGRQPLSTRTLAEMYRHERSTQVLRLEKLPIWFAPDPTAPANAWTPLPPGTSEAEVQQQFESAVRLLAAASRSPTLVLLGRSTTPSFGTRKPDMVGYVAMAPAEPAGAAVPVSRTVTLSCVSGA